MQVKAGELSFNVVETGAGEPALLFLHYWGGSARTWNVVTSELSADFRCIAYDQRGWGHSDIPQEGYSIRDLALDAKRIAEALHLRHYVLAVVVRMLKTDHMTKLVERHTMKIE